MYSSTKKTITCKYIDVQIWRKFHKTKHQQSRKYWNYEMFCILWNGWSFSWPIWGNQSREHRLQAPNPLKQQTHAKAGKPIWVSGGVFSSHNMPMYHFQICVKTLLYCMFGFRNHSGGNKHSALETHMWDTWDPPFVAYSPHPKQFYLCFHWWQGHLHHPNLASYVSNKSTRSNTKSNILQWSNYLYIYLLPYSYDCKYAYLHSQPYPSTPWYTFRLLQPRCG